MLEEIAICRVCRDDAIARMDGVWLCARCGLQGTTASSPSRSAEDTGWRHRRVALRTALASGLAAKVLIGAAAVAAVGGAVAGTTVPQPDFPHPPATQPPPQSPLTQDVPPTPSDGTEAGGVAAGGQITPASGSLPGTPPEPIASFVEGVLEWSACVDAAVHAFAESPPGTGFDPFAECPDRPVPPGAANAQRGRPEFAGRPDDPGSQAANPGRGSNPRAGR